MVQNPSTKDLDFIIGTHAQNDIHAITAVSVQKLYPFGWKFFWDIRGAGGAARTRNMICTKFLRESPCPYLIFIDRDIGFEPKDIQNILEDLNNGYKLVGGCYAVKDASQLASYGIEENGGITLNRKVQEVKWLATGFMAINKSLLKDMVEKLELPLMHEGQWSEAYPFFEQRHFWDGKEWIWLTEDYEFCWKAREVGAKPYIDTRVWVKHIGDYAYSVDEVIKRGNERRAIKFIQAEKDRFKYAIIDLAEFTGESQQAIMDKVNFPPHVKLAQMWHEHKARGGSTKDFYIDNDWYLYDEIQFNGQAGYWKYRMIPLLNIQHSLVLDIGCGIGTAVFMLSRNANQVMGFDINKRVIDFANFRKKKYNIQNVEFVTKLPIKQLPKFDYVIAIDTLEHIANLEPLMNTLGKHMKRGARFFHLSPFAGFSDTSPMHYDHSKELPGLMKKAGFLQWDPLNYIKS